VSSCHTSPVSTQWAVVTDIIRRHYYFRSYTHKNWRYVDVKAAMKDAGLLAATRIPGKTVAAPSGSA